MKTTIHVAFGLLAGVALLVGGCATAPRVVAAPQPQLVPLKLYWDGHDNFTTATVAEETDAKAAGYHFVRIEGYIFAQPQSNTLTLTQYWSAKRHDYMLLGHGLAATLKKNANYQPVRVEGYAYAHWLPGCAPLKRFNLTAHDNFTTGTEQGEKDALAAGYKFQRIEGYVLTTANDPNAVTTTEPLPASKTSEVQRPAKKDNLSAKQIRGLITQLGAADFSKRESVVNTLAQHPVPALSALAQALKKERDEDRRWWLQAAIQACEEEAPKLGEISASPAEANGLQARSGGDGIFEVVEEQGVSCWKAGKPASYIYFSASDEFRNKASKEVEIEMEYLDVGTGAISLDYDSSYQRAPVGGAYKHNATVIHCTNSGEWRRARFDLPNAEFHGAENLQADFRFYTDDGGMVIRAVRVWPVGARGND